MPLGGLGPSITDEQSIAHRIKNLKLKDYARQLREMNKANVKVKSYSEREEIPHKPPNARGRALEYASKARKIRPAHESSTILSSISSASDCSFDKSLEEGKRIDEWVGEINKLIIRHHELQIPYERIRSKYT